MREVKEDMAGDGQLELWPRTEDGPAGPDRPLQIQNRKYLGSKNRLLPFLQRVILAQAGPIGLFVDGFSGTGVVAYRFRPNARRIVANDLLYSNYVMGRAYLGPAVDTDRIHAWVVHLNSLPPVHGYAYRGYGGTYFSLENAGRIDAIREEIEALRESGECSEQERFVLLASLLCAVDKVGNTVGQYDAYLKHLGKTPYDSGGRHRVDSNVYKPLRLRVPAVGPHPESAGRAARCEVYNEDVNRLIERIEGDVLYLDPPYNTRQYCDLYHVLENIAVWAKPVLTGKTSKFDRTHLKSRYSSRRAAADALSRLAGRARFRHIFLSYNSEGIIPPDAIRCILEARGPTQLYETDYPVFGNGAGRAFRRTVTERLYHCRVATQAGG